METRLGRIGLREIEKRRALCAFLREKQGEAVGWSVPVQPGGKTHGNYDIERFQTHPALDRGLLFGSGSGMV